MPTKQNLIKVSDYLWEIPKEYQPGMLVPARVFASEDMLSEIVQDRSLSQLCNVACLPGVQTAALAMPDVHEGYGFPVGGVAAFDTKTGIISPGGIGYDINCGVRLLASTLTAKEIDPHLANLGRTLFAEIPSGVGRSGQFKYNLEELDLVLANGARQLVTSGHATEADLGKIESEGRLDNADPALVSELAKKRGQDQLGTMGAGNHFVEVDVVETIYDEAAAKSLGLFADQAVVLIHTGSRGLGHQIATDNIREMVGKLSVFGLDLPDRELASAPFDSPEGQKYFAAMAAGANFAWANRQAITFEVRRAWERVLGRTGGNLSVVYDVAHNIAKLEEHKVGGVKKQVVVHRKGATRAFPGQPVLIPGSMGTFSYVLLGQPGAMEVSFGSCCHGAGRRMSRGEAKRQVSGKQLRAELKEKGIVINAGSDSGLAEEAPLAYKDVDQVVDVVAASGIAKKVVRLRPKVVVKG